MASSRILDSRYFDKLSANEINTEKLKNVEINTEKLKNVENNVEINTEKLKNVEKNVEINIEKLKKLDISDPEFINKIYVLDNGEKITLKSLMEYYHSQTHKNPAYLRSVVLTFEGTDVTYDKKHKKLSMTVNDDVSSNHVHFETFDKHNYTNDTNALGQREGGKRNDYTHFANMVYNYKHGIIYNSRNKDHNERLYIIVDYKDNSNNSIEKKSYIISDMDYDFDDHKFIFDIRSPIVTSKPKSSSHSKPHTNSTVNEYLNFQDIHHTNATITIHCNTNEAAALFSGCWWCEVAIGAAMFIIELLKDFDPEEIALEIANEIAEGVAEFILNNIESTFVSSLTTGVYNTLMNSPFNIKISVGTQTLINDIVTFLIFGEAAVSENTIIAGICIATGGCTLATE